MNSGNTVYLKNKTTKVYLANLVKFLKPKCMKTILLTLFCFAPLSAVIAQNKFTDREYAKAPKWIAMIRDTSVNYFEAEKAYKIYFEHHEKPAGEQEDIGHTPDNDTKMSRKKMRQMETENNMRIEMKKYERWHQKVFPFVQKDGTILTPSQRLEIWKQNQGTK